MSSTTANSTPSVAMPNPSPDWSAANPAFPSFQLNGIDDTPGPKAYFIQLQAKQGKFLRDINDGVNQEPGTGPWFALRYSQYTFAIFEAFPGAEARHAHDAGPGGQNFSRNEFLKDVLAEPAQIYRLDVMHGKFDTMFGNKVAPVEKW
jgi:hypothetical protein